jgi:exodeoxyribonuclease-3
MKLITYNLNGIRSAMTKGWVDWIKENGFDVICVQELKADSSQVDTTVFDQLDIIIFGIQQKKKDIVA